MIARRAGQLLLIFLGVAAIGVILVGVLQRPGETVGQVAIQQCRTVYARATTLAESTAAGRTRPITGRSSATTALTCEAIRQRGWLR